MHLAVLLWSNYAIWAGELNPVSLIRRREGPASLARNN